MNFTDFKNTKYFECLDFLRFVSIILVIWHHTGSEMLNHSPSNIAFGHYGVNMFFVISGFLITTLLLREKSKYNKISYPKFFMRRVLRIFPLYYLTVAVYCILVKFFESDVSRSESFWSNLPYFLTYTSNLFVDLDSVGTIFYFSWSLATEEQFYIFWPVCLVLFSNNFALGIMISFMILKSISGFDVFPDTPSFILSRIPYTICLSSAVAILLFQEKIYKKISRIFIFSHSPVVYLIFVFIIFILGNQDFYNILPIAMTLLVCSSILNRDFLGKSLFTSKVFVSFGKVSYGMYLLHMIASNIVRKFAFFVNVDMHPVVYFLLTTVLTYFIALVSFNTFEKFFLNLKVKYAV